MSDVAEAAGVAMSSVSRALSGHPDVSDTMRAKVAEAVDRLGYEPDFVAQSLRSGSTKTIALLARDISNPLFAEMAKGAETATRDAGYSIIVVNSDGNSEIEAEHVRRLRRRKVDGYLVSLVDEGYGASVEELERSGASIVLLDRESPQLRAGAILCDHYHGVRSAVDHLAKAGLADRVAVITGSKSSRPTRERIRGVRDGLTALGTTLEDRYVRTSDWSEENARLATIDLLSMDEPPTAIISGGTQSTIGIVEALAQTPTNQHPALIACDNMPLLDQVAYPIGVVSRNTRAMGEEAAKLLLEMLEGKPPRVVTIPTVYRGR